MIYLRSSGAVIDAPILTSVGLNSTVKDTRSNDIHIKVFINVLKNWRGTYSDEHFFRTLLHKFMDDRCDEWKTPFLAMEDTWQESNSEKLCPFGKLITKEMIDTAISVIEENVKLPVQMPVTPVAKTLSELLELNSFETTLLHFSMQVRRFDYPLDDIYRSLRLAYDTKEVMYSTIFNVDLDTVRAALNGDLINTGILINNHFVEGFFQPAYQLIDIMQDENAGREDIERRLFPATLDTELDISDYEHISADVTRTERIIDSSLKNRSLGINIMFWGQPGTGKTELAAAIAKKNGWSIRSIGDSSKADMEEKGRFTRLANLKIALKLFTRDTNTILLFDEIEDLFKTDNDASFSKAFLNRIIETSDVPIIWTTNSLFVVGDSILRRMTYNINCGVPPKKNRRKIWAKYAERYSVDLDDQTIKVLDNYDIAPALIRNAMMVTGAALNSNVPDPKEVQEIVSSLDRLVNYGHIRKFDTDPEYTSNYDVSCVNSTLPLMQFTERLRNVTSNAFSLCLYGPPGTGKSEYGRYLCAQLGKQLLFRRASDLLGKFVGETEANIAQAFKQAKEDGKVLLIDEGDTFLRNRERAERSWEVSQVNEMLSQMEKHPEPFILTTNLFTDLDPAALRRFTFKMKFDYLKPEQAAKLFRTYYGVEAPVRIGNNHLLTPGDIACVAKQVKILGLSDAEEIYQLIEGEIALKPDYAKPLGF